MNSQISGYWPIDGIKVPVRVGPRVGPVEAESWDDYRPISAAELYGILWSNRATIEEVILTCTDPIFLVIHYEDWFVRDACEFFKLSWAEMSEFLSYYCGISVSDTNWKEEGF